MKTPATASSNLAPDAELREIEAIKRLKARYFRLLDTKQWDAWAEVFTEDVTVRIDRGASTWGGDLTEPLEWSGRDALAPAVRAMIHDSVTVHHGHMPEIELTSATTAKGVWAMEDIVESSTRLMQGHGHYHETYRRTDGVWRISTLHLTRLRVNILSRTAPRVLS